MTTDLPVAARTEFRRFGAVVAVVIGNALEWFDFVIYGYFAAVIAKVFFPLASDVTAILLTFATFGVTFIMRPLGAIVIGDYSDRHGRKAALQLSMVLMMIGTAMIALLPSYSNLGLLAPVLVAIARMIQGFSAGGEFGSATAFLVEQNPDRRGFYASWQFASQGLAAALATGFGAALSAVLSTSEIESWGWRVPFFFGILIGPIAYYIRRHTVETSEFRSVHTSASPIAKVLLDGKQRLVVAIGVVSLGTVSMYTILFMPTYALREMGVPATMGYAAGLLTAAILFVVVPITGALSDKYGRIPITAIAAFSLLILIYPMFYWLTRTPTLQTLLIVQAMLGVLTAAYIGAIPALMSELFPVSIRTTGLAVSYAMGVSIFGGFAPFIHTSLIGVTGSKLAPGIYVIFAAVISLLALARGKRFGIK